MSSAKSSPPLCHHIAQETVLLTYSLECPHRRAVFTLHLSWKMRQWRTTLMKHSNGFIHPSSSPAASSFFFVGKKDSGLHPCIEYCSLNDVTVKNRFPLPLIPVTLEQVDRANI